MEIKCTFYTHSALHGTIYARTLLYIYYMCNLLIFKHLYIGVYIYAHFLFYAVYLCSVYC